MNIFKQTLALFLTVLLTLGTCQVTFAEENWPVQPDISAPSAIVMEADTGAILYEKDIHARNYPASITKIMTTLLAIENCSLNDVVTFSYDSVHKVEGSNAGLLEGEQLTVDQCLYAIMLASANEAAYAVAEHVGGTLPDFVNLMNQKAASLGCKDTHFNNPHGLPDENHYTSAYDMALIAKAAYANPTFRTVTGTKSYTLPATNLSTPRPPIVNHHKMLTKTSYQYDGCTGGKTGYTNAARNTLVTYAEKNGMKLICVIMRDDVSYSQYVDTTTLLNYGFQNFHKLDVSDNTSGLHLDTSGLFPINHTPFSENNIVVSFGSNSDIVLPNGLNISDITATTSYEAGEANKIADITYNYNQHYLGKVCINCKTDVNKNNGLLSQKSTIEQDSNQVQRPLIINLKTIFLIILILLAAIAIAFSTHYFIYNYHITEKSRLHKNNKLYRNSKIYQKNRLYRNKRTRPKSRR